MEAGYVRAAGIRASSERRSCWNLKNKKAWRDRVAEYRGLLIDDSSRRERAR